MKIGLVLEGGGFRGVFVEGITNWLLEQQIELPYVIGVSMGAINGTNYLAKQNKRNIEIIEQFINDPRYISKRNLITKGGLFGMDFIFNDIAHIHHPFDFKAFEESTQELVIGAMNCETGRTTYIKKSESTSEDMMVALRASASLPFVSQKVGIEDIPHLDGGISDPIPVRKAFEDGCDKVIVVLTRDENYVKEQFKGASISKVFYRKQPKVLTSLQSRHYIYTETQHHLKTLEAEGKALVIRPNSPLDVSRTEKEFTKVYKAYTEGYHTAEEMKDKIINFIKA